jgi:LysR family nitrogen assimilation transcriptional regulator
MQLRHLRYFVEIVEAGSFSRAAAIIRVAQPALSSQIANLEEEIGVNLLHRSSRGVRPTAAGETLYREAASILRQMEQLPGKVRSTGSVTEGAVNLGMTPTLAALVAGPFMEACRDVMPRVALRFMTGHTLLIASRLEARTLDFGLVFAPEDVPLPGFVRQALFHQRLFLLSRADTAVSGRTVSLSEVARRPLALPQTPHAGRDGINRAFAAEGLVPAVTVEADTMSGLVAAVENGLGDTIVATGDVSILPTRITLVATLIEPPVYVTAFILFPADAPPGGASDHVRRLLVEFVTRRLVESAHPGAEWIGDVVL